MASVRLITLVAFISFATTSMAATQEDTWTAVESRVFALQRSEPNVSNYVAKKTDRCVAAIVELEKKIAETEASILRLKLAIEGTSSDGNDKDCQIVLWQFRQEHRFFDDDDCRKILEMDDHDEESHYRIRAIIGTGCSFGPERDDRLKPSNSIPDADEYLREREEYRLRIEKWEAYIEEGQEASRRDLEATPTMSAEQKARVLLDHSTHYLDCMNSGLEELNENLQRYRQWQRSATIQAGPLQTGRTP